MKITTLLTVFIALLLAVPLVDVAAQEKEGALINGQIALKFSAGGKGSTYVLLQKRGDEDALVFPVVHYHAVLYAQAPGCNGLMYVTPSRIVFNSQTKKSHSFDILRTEIKKVESQKSGRFGKNIGNHIFIDAKDGSKRFAVMFENSADVGFQGDYMKPVLEFFDLAVTDFAAATRQFQELTAQARKAQSEANAAAQLGAQIEALRAQMETKTREESDKAFNETLLHKEELQRSLSPQTLSAARDALRSLRKIAGATEIGVTAEQYGSRLIDVKADVDEALLGMPNNPLKTEFQLAVDALVDAHQAWGSMNANRSDSLFPNLEPGTTLMKKYSIPVDTSIGMPLLPRSRVLTAIWTEARKHIDRASLLLAQ